MDILEIKRNMEVFKQKMIEIEKHANIENSRIRIAELEKLTLVEGFWDDKKKSEAVIKEANELKEKVGSYDALMKEADELKVLIEFVDSGEHEFEKELDEKYKKYSKDINEYETKLLLDGEYDYNNTIIMVHSGAGGTEACDWAEMLFRMYTKWCGAKGYGIDILDKIDGDGAGVKSITFLVKGPYAFGYLKSEKGVHRLVRISPFDSNKRRHTSFASVDVFPEIDDTIEININPGDLRVETFRAGGAGGQHVNVTDSAVRITHLPTKIVVSCQNERSQIQNKDKAMKVLKARLFEYERKKQDEEIKKMKGEAAEISWGNQIRSYVFQPYTLTKDHRTGCESGNILAVMDGDIDGFISEYLKWQKTGL